MRTKINGIILGRKMTQSELARKVGIKREYLNRIINNRINPSVYLAIRIAKALTLPVEDLFSLE
jgi:putative transcriptional regulator